MAHHKILTAEETKEKYSSILDKSSIKPDRQSFVQRANICLNVFRLVQAHLLPTEVGKVSHVSCFHYWKHP